MSAVSTRAVRAGLNCDPGHDAVVAPIAVSSAYRREDPATPGAFDYARTGAPGRAELARALASLEEAEGAIITSSGMAAIDLILNLLPRAARIVCAHDCYGGTRRLFDARAVQRGWRVDYVDLTDAETAQHALSAPAALVFIETPSNPRLRITDIEAVCAQAAKAGAISVVDNTVLGPALQRPIPLGADLTVSSLTKIINGHSDMVGGAICARSPGHLEALAWWANAGGAVAGAFDAFLAIRGLRTLALRSNAQSQSALELAHQLSADPRVKRVDHPGLAPHEGHDIAARQQAGFGPLLSLEIKSDPRRFVQALEVFTLAQSLGGVESLAAIPATMTHAAMTAQARAEAGISDGLIRLSVGLEDLADLWADLDTALSA